MISKLTKLSNEFASKHRKMLLKSILKQIRNEEFQNISIDPNQLYLLHSSVRREYQAPRDVSGYNWGAMRTWEMDASMSDTY